MFTKARSMRYDSGRALVSTDPNRVSTRNWGQKADPFYSQSPEGYRVAR